MVAMVLLGVARWLQWRCYGVAMALLGGYYGVARCCFGIDRFLKYCFRLQFVFIMLLFFIIKNIVGNCITVCL